MIDSEHFKVRDFKDNSFIIQPYEESEVLEHKEDQMEILMKARDYILKVLNEAEDIPDFL